MKDFTERLAQEEDADRDRRNECAHLAQKRRKVKKSRYNQDVLKRKIKHSKRSW